MSSMQMTLKEKVKVLKGMGEYFTNRIGSEYYCNLIVKGHQYIPLVSVGDSRGAAVDKLYDMVSDWVWDEITL
jgi:hypothetical protein